MIDLLNELVTYPAIKMAALNFEKSIKELNVQAESQRKQNMDQFRKYYNDQATE